MTSTQDVFEVTTMQSIYHVHMGLGQRGHDRAFAKRLTILKISSQYILPRLWDILGVHVLPTTTLLAPFYS